MHTGRYDVEMSILSETIVKTVYCVHLQCDQQEMSFCVLNVFLTKTLFHLTTRCCVWSDCVFEKQW